MHSTTPGLLSSSDPTQLILDTSRPCSSGETNRSANLKLGCPFLLLRSEQKVCPRDVEEVHPTHQNFHGPFLEQCKGTSSPNDSPPYLRPQRLVSNTYVYIYIYMHAAGCLKEPQILTPFARNMRKRSAKCVFL